MWTALDADKPLDFGSAIAQLRSGNPIIAIKEIRELTGADPGTAKAKSQHIATAEDTCHRCSNPLEDERPHTTCTSCGALNYRLE